MINNISDLAEVHADAQISNRAKIGPFCRVGPNVTIGEDTVLDSNVTIVGHTVLGRGNRCFPGVVIGADPQDVSYRGSPTEVRIGDNNVFRECVTVNRATEKEDGVTSVGDGGYFMACSHIAHDCKVGNHVHMANNVLLGGHVHVGDHVNLSGSVAIHHFSTIGSYAFVGGLSRVVQDVPPYLIAEGSPARPRAINIVALKRNGFQQDEIDALRKAYKLIFRQKVEHPIVRDTLLAHGELIPSVNQILNFLDKKEQGRNGRARQKRVAA
ncbi:MAG: acyl-[acyl-carrier-protein]--UDP-N-acetylglucosamine O-acyltransferase [Planctomycetaceae bacterium]|nr:acyl-[acyl-carrier-protein]--UDP-N-acetylglucosamine O-acyltransferase [Planctomycetaceae bacterium]